MNKKNISKLQQIIFFCLGTILLLIVSLINGLTQKQMISCILLYFGVFSLIFFVVENNNYNHVKEYHNKDYK